MVKNERPFNADAGILTGQRFAYRLTISMALPVAIGTMHDDFYKVSRHDSLFRFFSKEAYREVCRLARTDLSEATSLIEHLPWLRELVNRLQHHLPVSRWRIAAA